MVDGWFSIPLGNKNMPVVDRNACDTSIKLVRTESSKAYTLYLTVTVVRPVVLMCQVFLFILGLIFAVGSSC
jgi:hypothetical protein